MVEKIKIRNFEFDEEELMNLPVDVFRSLLHERAHHGIEVYIYHILNGTRPTPANFGREAKILLDFWKKRGLPLDEPDIVWASNYLNYAEKIQRGEKLDLKLEPMTPYSSEELKIVDKLLFTRRTIRQWKDDPVPDWMIDEVLRAGLAAPNACNMNCQRFLVLKDKESMNIIKGDCPIPPVKIVICNDMRIYDFMGLSKQSPQNIYLDAAAVADHMILKAHALGLGGAWLTHQASNIEELRKHLKIPDYYRMDTHIALGFPNEIPIKSARMSLKNAKLNFTH